MTGHEHTRPVFGCEDCIARAERGSADPKAVPEGWHFYHVEVTQSRVTTYWVLAATKRAAEADAREIQPDDSWFWDDESQDHYVGDATDSPPAGEPLWTGGPNGDWDETKESERK